MGRRKQVSEHEKTAFTEGWQAAGRGSSRHERPNYSDSRDRESFDEGFMARCERLRMGYKDEPASTSKS